MDTETLRIAQPQESLSERLYELTPEEHETRAAWLGRAALVAEEFADYRVDERELGYIQKLLPNWYFTPGKIRSKHFGIARRIGPVSAGQIKELPLHKTSRSVAAMESGNIVLLASTALHGTDISSVFEIERANENLADKPVATPLPKPKRKIEGINGSTTLDPAELDRASGLRVTRKDREILRLLPLSTNAASERLSVGIDSNAAKKRVRQAIERNNMGRANFLSQAIKGDLIDMNLLPKTGSYTLTKNEKRLLSNHPFDNRTVAAKGLGVTVEEVSEIRKSINRKFGTPPELRTSTHMFLIAKRDGAI